MPQMPYQNGPETALAGPPQRFDARTGPRQANRKQEPDSVAGSNLWSGSCEDLPPAPAPAVGIVLPGLLEATEAQKSVSHNA